MASHTTWRGQALERLRRVGALPSSSRTASRLSSPTHPPLQVSSHHRLPRPSGFLFTCRTRRPTPARSRSRTFARQPPASRKRSREEESSNFRARLCISKCENHSVRPSSRAVYDLHRQRVLAWARQATVVLRWDRPALLDRHFVLYLDHLLETSRPTADAEKTLAAVVFSVSGLARSLLPTANRALKGFRRVRPHQSRPPIPEEISCGIVVWLLLR